MRGKGGRLRGGLPPARRTAAREADRWLRRGEGIGTLDCMTPFLLLALLAADSPDSEPSRPNVLMIVADDLGFGDLACYGAPDLRTPALDKLAATGQRWTNFYANCPVCSPTRAALLSGQYQDLVGVPGVIRTHAENSWGDLVDDAVLLPSVLRDGGYRTACIGKWHLGLEGRDVPTERGFERFDGFLGDMMDDYYTHRRHDINYMTRAAIVDGTSRSETIDPQGHATDLFTDWAIDELRRSEGDERPFFLYLAYNAPHTPIQPPDDWLAEVKNVNPEMPDKRAKLVALIEHMDHGIGRVLGELDTLGLADSTVVMFTSDNGGQVNVGARNGPHRGTKGEVYEGGIAVPTIVRGPGLTTAGSTTDTLALSMDLTATVAELAGVSLPGSRDGVSLVRALQTGTQPPVRETHFFRRREGGIAYNGQTIDAVRMGRWKLLQNKPTQPYEMYDLEADPLEERDLFTTGPKSIRRQLLDALSRHRQRCGAVPWQATASGGSN